MEKIKTERKPKLIVSLTSYPARIDIVNQVIESILTQTLSADKVVLWLAPEQFPDKKKALPKQLLDLIPQGLTIDWYHDIKSYKKLIPALIKYPDDIIVTADDDLIYEKEWLERLFLAYQRNSNGILAHRIHKIRYSYRLSPYAEWGGESKDLIPSFLNFATGVGGVLYPPHSLYKDILNEEKFMKLCPTNDDIWFWAMAVLNSRKPCLIENNYTSIRLIKDTQATALWHENVVNKKNDIQMQDILKAYPELCSRLKEEQFLPLWNMKFITTLKNEREVLNTINPLFKSNIEQSQSEYEFLFSLTKQTQPRKVLELGVSRGSSAVVLLSAIKELEDAHLYSIDYNENHYKDVGKKTGFVMDSYPELKEKWKLFTGDVAGKFMEEIGGDIDMVFIDTVHFLPGEALDFLMVLPYLKENAIVVFYDTNYQALGYNYGMINNLLMSSIVGEKILPEFAKDFYFEAKVDIPFPNIGAIQINRETRENIWNIFNILSIPWSYMPKEKDILIMREAFKKHYDSLYRDMFEKSLLLAKTKLEERRLKQQQIEIEKEKQQQQIIKTQAKFEELEEANFKIIAYTSHYLYFTYLRYRIASELTFGKRRKYYKQKKHALRILLDYINKQ